MGNGKWLLLASLVLPLGGCATSSPLAAKDRLLPFGLPQFGAAKALGQTFGSTETPTTNSVALVKPDPEDADATATAPEQSEGSLVEPANHEALDVPPAPADKSASVARYPDLPRLESEILPIDLVTVIRLVDLNSPAIGYSRARVEEAVARADAADLQWLPKLSIGATYSRFDGQTQNQRGEIFSVSRSNLFANGGASLSLDLAEAIYRPLIERQVANAEQQRANATSLFAEMDAIGAYLDLTQVHGLIEINAQTLEEGEAMLLAAQHAQEAKLDRSPGDVNRVRTEILLRRQERLDLQGRAGVASARLGRLLLLKPSVRLVPENTALVPITLVGSEVALDDLVSIAIQNRPDLAANRDLLSAAWARFRMAQRGPFLPKLQVIDQGGSFGGGLNANMQNFEGRNALIGGVYWELKNLGFGNQLETQERRAGIEQAQFQLLETQARLSAEVVEAAQAAAAKFQMLAVAEQTVKEASELYRINEEGTFNVIDAKNLFDALRPLQALQMLQQARQSYLTAIIDYNRSQYRLYTSIGCPHSAIEVPELNP